MKGTRFDWYIVGACVGITLLDYYLGYPLMAILIAICLVVCLWDATIGIRRG